MLIPNERLLQALKNLGNAGNEDWEIFADWLEASYNQQTIMLIDLDDERQASLFAGRCRELKELRYYLANSEYLLEEHQQGQREPLITMTSAEATSVID